MRELKFRVWDNLSKTWLKNKIYHANIAVGEDGVGEFCFKQEPDGYAILQYTGLKDSQGKEIYVGDIVKLSFTLEAAKSILPKNIFEMKVKPKFRGFIIGKVSEDFGEGILSHFGYYVGGFIPFWKLKSLINKSGIEIIGNIFENPELLENDSKILRN